jgi:hypothetical protein
VSDRNQRLASGSVNEPGNTTTYAADTLMSIASASKWPYGAYVVEKRSGMLTAQDIQFLSFNSGYTSLAAVATAPRPTPWAHAPRGATTTCSITTAATCRSTLAWFRQA